MSRMYTFLGHYTHHDRRSAATVAVSTQTDFAARTPLAIAFADTLAMVICGGNFSPGTSVVPWSEAAALAWPHGGTCEAARMALSTQLGEQIEVHDTWIISHR